VFEESTTLPSLPYPGLNTSHACSIHSHDSEKESLIISMADVQQLPSISMIDIWRADKHQPWSQYNLSHPIGDHVERIFIDLEQLADAERVKNKGSFQEVQASECASDKQKPLPDLHCIGGQFFVEPHYTIENIHQEEIIETSLEDVGSLAAKLATSQTKHNEFAPQTLKKEFELARGLEGMGQYEEAEYHCRRILDIHSEAVVEALLGTILAKTHRFEEATFRLFRALAGFIILFIQNSLEENASLFARIESVFEELLLRGDEGVPSLTDHWSLMRDTLQRPISDGEIYQICPQLFLHGFSFAHECLALGLVDYDQYLLESARCLYRDLLEHSSRHLDVVHHAIEKATAHQGYARLLRKEKKWIPSAKQWLLACESALDSTTHDRELTEILESDYHKLLLRLNCEPNEEEEDSLKEIMKKAFASIRAPSPFSMEHISEPTQGSHVEEYLLSSDSPLHMINLEPSAVSQVARFGLCLGIPSSAYGHKDRTSTTSVTASTSHMSHQWGKTMSAGENRGLGMVF
jgi:tetratricopeptide (TPR) repeat protein